MRKATVKLMTARATLTQSDLDRAVKAAAKAGMAGSGTSTQTATTSFCAIKAKA